MGFGQCVVRVAQRFGTTRDVLGVVTVLALVVTTSPLGAQTTAPGGFLETATSTDVRPPVTPTLPSRGPFTFPAPYNTTGIRLTNASDCGGADCVDYVGYSYWRNTNNHVGSNTMLMFLTLDRARGGGGPTLFSLDKTTDQVTKIGPLFDSGSALSWASGEGWYWSATQATKLYVSTGTVLARYDVNARQLETVFDASTQYPGTTIWQAHSSYDDKVHSATLRDGAGALGCLVYNETTRQFSFFAKTGDFDECQIDKSGRWLLIKEQVDGANGEDNVIVDLATGQQTTFYDQYGAAGHSDNGHGYMVAEDNWYPLPGAVRVWTFGQPFPTSEPGTPPQGQLVYRTTDWSANAGHISHADARAGVALAQQYACASNANRLSLPRTNEVVCFRLDGSLQVLVAAPVMTNLDAAGGGDDYSKLPKGNLDVTGQYFIWTSNVGGSRLDAFIVKIPAQLLVTQTGGGGGSGDTTPPTVVITAPVVGAASGAVTIAADASDNVGVAGVQFKIDGANLGAEITTAPYAMVWDTSASSDGTYTLTAVARDAAGNLSVSAGVAVTVVNHATGPNVSIASPTNGGSVSGTLTIRAEASAASGVRGVQFMVDGVGLGPEVTTPPYVVSWTTTGLVDGIYTLTAAARDGEGHAVTSAGVSVSVVNHGSGPSGVVWTNLVNATGNGGSLSKTGGCDGCDDAGAVSQQQILAAGGYLEFAISEPTSVRSVGLSENARSTGAAAAMSFALRFQSGIVEVRERGVYRADTFATAGDVFRVSVESGAVHYYRNGARFYTSSIAPSYPLQANAALLHLVSSVTNAVLSTGGGDPAPSLGGLSTRGRVETGNNVMIGGLIVEGPAPKTFLLRGRGPSMGGAPFFVPGTLANPLLRIFSGATLIGENDNWQDAPSCSVACGTADAIVATGLDPCRANPGQATAPPGCGLESAMLITLAPGAYTVQLSGASGESGVGLLEAFEVDATEGSARLQNISTRGLVRTGNEIMIAGLIVDGSHPRTVLLRGRGPSLGGAPFFVPGPLANPQLSLYSASSLIARSQNWQDPPDCSAELVCGRAADIVATGLDPCQPNPGQTTAPPGCALEAAILVTLSPGAYTMQLNGASGEPGVGLVEIFQLD